MIDMRVENEDTRSSWVPIRRIDGKHMQRTDEWCKHPEYDVQDVGIDSELKLSIMCADENEEEFAKRLRHCQALHTNELVKHVFSMVKMCDDIPRGLR